MPRTGKDDWFSEPDELQPTTEPWDFPLERRRKRGRIAKSATVVTLFFAGAAFTAGAGDLTATRLQADSCAGNEPAASLAEEAECAAAEEAAAAPEAPAEAAPAEPAAAEPAPEAEPSAPAAPETASAEESEPAAESIGSRAGKDSGAAANEPTAAPAAGGGNAAGEAAGAPSSSNAPDDAEPLLRPAAPPAAVPLKEWQTPAKKRPAAPAPEIEGFGTPTIWLNRALPDPTPPAKRLKGTFAAELASSAKRAGVDWALTLAVLRASGENGAAPATKQELRRLSARLAALGGAKDPWAAALALDGHTAFADRVAALTHYNRAIGLWALVHGLEAAKEPLSNRLLEDPQISIYAGGRSDLAENRVDVRVVALITYLRESFGQITVTSLVSGHRVYARPGVVSAHVYGHALDIASLGGTSILGNQEPGSVTERAVRAILLLPSELQPRQVISLLGMGGPSFPLQDHADHIHVGY